MGRKTQVIHRYMRKERKNGGNTDGDSMGRKRGERLRGTGDEQERERSRGKKEKGGTERDRQTEVGKGRREEREERGEGAIRTRKSRYKGKDRHTKEQIALQDRQGAPGGQETENAQSPSMPAPTFFLPRLLSRAPELQARPFPAGQRVAGPGACPAVSVHLFSNPLKIPGP